MISSNAGKFDDPIAGAPGTPRFDANQASTRVWPFLGLWRSLTGADTRGRRASAESLRLSMLEQENADLQRKIEQLTRREAYARYLANHDGLTGLCNRSMLMDRFVHASAHAQRCGHPMTLLLFDLDGFKAVNDQFGHLAGDHLLQRISRRLETMVRAGDTTCRYGGDEFVLLLPGIDSPAVASALALRIQQEIADCLRVAGIDAAVTASCGIAVYPEHGTTWNALLATADAAMYQSKPCSQGTTLNARSERHERWRQRHDRVSALRLPDAKPGG